MSEPENYRIVVFTGPSLHPSQARALLNATFLPPVKRGDLTPLLASKPCVVGIIDGEFYQTLAVAPKEVLALIEAGTTVYGASSIGALRAVELDRYGMIGVGAIYRLFRRGILDSDDEVALAYSKQTYQPVSEPLINIRFSLRAAVRRRLLDPAEAAEAAFGAVGVARARPHATEIFLRLRDLAAEGITKPTGQQMFGGASRDARSWDLHAEEMPAEELVWLIAALRARETNPGQGRGSSPNPG